MGLPTAIKIGLQKEIVANLKNCSDFASITERTKRVIEKEIHSKTLKT